jgi:hypothetical protein
MYVRWSTITDGNKCLEFKLGYQQNEQAIKWADLFSKRFVGSLHNILLLITFVKVLCGCPLHCRGDKYFDTKQYVSYVRTVLTSLFHYLLELKKAMHK